MTATVETLRVATPAANRFGDFSDAPEVGRSGDRTLLRALIIAEQGEFKDAGRGEFDAQGLRTAANLMQASKQGARFGHATQSDDKVGAFVGEWINARFESGKLKADLLFSTAASNLPALGDVRSYVLSLAKETPWAINVSLQIVAERLTQGRGRSPLWLPLRILGADLVAVGAATNSLLGNGELSVRQANAEAAAKRRARCEALLAKAYGPNYKPAPRLTREAAIAKADAILRGGR